MSDIDDIQSVGFLDNVDVEAYWNSRNLLCLGILNHGFVFGASRANPFDRWRGNTRVLEPLNVGGAYEQDTC